MDSDITGLLQIAQRSAVVHSLRMLLPILAFALSLTFSGSDSFGASAEADTFVSIDPDDVLIPSFDGWGCSLCWWANEFGLDAEADTLADLCFTTRTVSWKGTPLPGLGLNIVRYNLGGCGDGTTSGGAIREKLSPRMASHKRLRAFRSSTTGTQSQAGGRAGGAGETGESGWNWEADPAQLAMLRKAVARGAGTVEFFSNSPPWWMCRNRSTAGSDGGGNNLEPGSLGAYCDYLASVATHARETWKIPVAWVAPFNEPSASWWKFPQRQEGCHFDRSTQRAVVSALRSSLNRRGLQPVRIAASDENDFNSALATWNQLGPAVQEAVAKVNVHGYSGLKPYRGKGRIPFRRAIGSAKAWVSEYGDADASGWTMVVSILRDLAELRPDGWVYWQPLDGGGWGLIQTVPEHHRPGSANRKWYAFAQFTRHIHPGSRVLAGSDPDSVIAWDSATRTVEVVTANLGPARWIEYDLSRFTPVKSAHSWTTTTSPGGAIPDLRYSPVEVSLAGNRCRIRAPENSVTSTRFADIQPRNP